MIRSHSKTRDPILVTRGFLVLLLGLLSLISSPAPLRAAGELGSTLDKMLEEMQPSVVAVEAHRPLFSSNAQDLRNRRLPGDFSHKLFVSSGVLIAGGHYIVTTASGVELGDSIVIRFHTGERIAARLHYEDRRMNVALIELDEVVSGVRSLPIREIPDSLSARGDWVAALGYSSGNPEPVLTIGQFFGRSYTRDGATTRAVLRTTVPIFPGSSGGLLVDADGNWIGLLSGSCYRPGAVHDCPNDITLGSGPQVALAIPVRDVLAAAERLEVEGRSSRAFLGVRISTEAESSGAAREDSAEGYKGLTIFAILEESPAAQAGLLAGDIILSIEGMPVNNMETLRDLVSQRESGMTMNLKIQREGRSFDRTVQLGDRRIYDLFAETREREMFQERQIQTQIRQLEQLLQRLRSSPYAQTKSVEPAPVVGRGETGRRSP
ncbi:MAG: S1C family serine protease [Candidatus Eisenbacteria bacterium]|uniref:S1C family serine protease n=1 Tax=Eiseniibacteriota bacterium TaxID=2212470 RepID=A0A948RW51_UNCEI|nr:S1C family serine protease [Candidatus Eisenbacteria bacterium]